MGTSSTKEVAVNAHTRIRDKLGNLFRAFGSNNLKGPWDDAVHALTMGSCEVSKKVVGLKGMPGGG